MTPTTKTSITLSSRACGIDFYLFGFTNPLQLMPKNNNNNANNNFDSAAITNRGQSSLLFYAVAIAVLSYNMLDVDFVCP